MQTITTHNTQQTRECASDFAHKVVDDVTEGDVHNPSATVICLSGDLGAGKTTFAQGLLEAFDAQPPYTSPTFIIIKTYALSDLHTPFRTIHHIDPYRITADDLRDLDWEDMIADPQTLIIVEWPQIVRQIIPDTAYDISIQSIDEHTRRITFS